MQKTIKSFGFALRGIKKLLREKNTRIHLLTASVVIITAFYLQVTLIEWCLLVFAIGLVIMAEGFNTSIEQLVDLLSPEQRPKAGIVKDLAAGAVLIAAIAAAAIGLIIFGPRMWELFVGAG